MLIQIRGTSGSGKTHVMREVMSLVGGWSPVYEEGRRRPLYYRSGGVAVLGSYENTCGGCDGIGAAPAVYELIRRVICEEEVGYVLAEGLLLSEDTKWTKRLHEEGVPLRVLFLTTPLERCLTQIEARRAAAGNGKPLNPSNTSNRVGVIERARVKLLGFGVKCLRLSSSQAPRVILNWIRVGE